MIGPFHINRPAFGDALDLGRQLPDESIHCIVTSPPYWGLRDYGVEGQLGLEKTLEEYVDRLVGIFHELRRALRVDGTLWLNLGDCYAMDSKWGGASGNLNDTSRRGGYDRRRKHTGLKPKDLVGIPWRVAFALQADGWYLRSDIIWNKPNPMPESVTDRPTKAHEYLFLMSKSERYYYDGDAIREPYSQVSAERYKYTFGGDGYQSPTKNPAAHPDGVIDQNPKGRNKRTVWSITTQPYPEAHFATFPTDLIKPCIMAGCPAGGVVLDPFLGSGTTGEVCQELGRNWIGFELNEDYSPLIKKRTRQLGLFAEASK